MSSFGTVTRLVLAASAAATFTAPAGLAAQDAASEPAIVSSRISTSADAAGMHLELRDGRTLDIEIEDGRVRIDDRDIGITYDPGGELDRAWRELIASGDGSPAALAERLRAWDPPSGPAGEAIDAALEDALGSTAAVAQTAASVTQAATPSPPQEPAPLGDSVDRLNERIEELQERLEDVTGEDYSISGLEGLRREIREEVRDELRHKLRDELRHELRNEVRAGGDDGGWFSPLRYVWRGLGGIFSMLAIYAVMIGIGFAVVYFGRDYLEGVADTARHYTVRSWLVGIAGSFLLLPTFVLGILALVISVVGIPLVIAWVPLFPVAVVAAALFGYIAIGHAAGEALAERRFYGGEWFKRANSYYYIMTGVGLLLLLHFTGYVVEMAGPWFGFVRGLLTFLSVVVTWAALTIGFGAVLLSRFGTRPLDGPSQPAEGSMFEEEGAHV